MLSRSGPTRSFAARLRAEGASALAVIAEVKRRSPSRGDLAPGLDPAATARDYARGGATCLSVLTDADAFGGSPDDLAAARAAVELPVLRKDFTVDVRDVYDARIMGADAVLLIAAALEPARMAACLAAAREAGLDALVEVHDGEELAAALDAGATMVGVNQRDLRTFEVDRGRAAALAPRIPAGVVRIAESGVRGADDALIVRDERTGAGYTKDFPVERYMREAKVMQIFEGTNQIQRMVIGRSLDREAGQGAIVTA